MTLTWLLLACAHTPEAPVVDISTPPTVAAAADFVPAVPTEHALENGLKIWLVERPGLPLVSLRLVIPGGSAQDPIDQHGVSSLTDEALKHGAGDRDATAFAAEVERLALSLSVSTGGTASVVRLDTHTDRLDQGLALMADMILRPRFAPEDIDRLKALEVGSLKEASDDPRTVAAWTVARQYYGEGHPLSHPIEGSLESLKALTAEQIRASYSKRYVPDNAVLVVAGDVTADVIKEKLNARLGDWKPSGATRLTIAAPPSHAGKKRHFFVNKPGTSQTALQVISPAPSALDAAAEPARLGAIVLGGTFTSRLNRLLREEKGYTYGARASHTGAATYGYLLARTNVQRDVSAPALVDLLDELQRYNDGIDEVELGKAMGAWQTRVVESMGSRASIADTFAEYAVDGLPMTTLGDSLDRAQAATVASVSDAAKQSVLDEAVVVVVGDLEHIQKPIEYAIQAEWTVLD